MPSKVLIANEFGLLFPIEGTPFVIPENTIALDSIYSVFTAPNSSIIFSDAMYQGDFQANIPLNARITGFECRFNGQATGASTTLRLNLFNDGSNLAIDKLVGFTGIFNTLTVGGPNDLWGGSFRPEDINNSLFQLGWYSQYNSFPFSGDVLRIDYLSLKVYYDDDSTFRNRGGNRDRLPWGVR